MKRKLLLAYTALTMGCTQPTQSLKEPQSPLPEPNSIPADPHQKHLGGYIRLQLLKELITQPQRPKLRIFGVTIDNPLYESPYDKCENRSSFSFNRFHMLWLKKNSEIASEKITDCPIRAQSNITIRTENNGATFEYLLPTSLDFTSTPSDTLNDFFGHRISIEGESLVSLEYHSHTSGVADMSESYQGFIERASEIIEVHMTSETVYSWDANIEYAGHTNRYWRLKTNNLVTQLREEITFNSSKPLNTQKTLFLNNHPIRSSTLKRLTESL